MLLKTMNSIINFKNEIPNNFLSLVELIEDDVMSNIDENTIKCNISVMIAMLDKYDNTEEEINEIDNPNNLIKRKKKMNQCWNEVMGTFITGCTVGFFFGGTGCVIGGVALMGGSVYCTTVFG